MALGDYKSIGIVKRNNAQYLVQLYIAEEVNLILPRGTLKHGTYLAAMKVNARVFRMTHDIINCHTGNDDSSISERMSLQSCSNK